jgi:hypothetical protein
VSEATERPQVLADLVNPAGLSLVAAMAKVSFALRAPSSMLFPIFDVLLFGLFGLGVGYMARWSRRFSVALLVLPSVIIAADIVHRLGPSVLQGGPGSEWAVSVFLMPAAAFGGAALGGRFGDRED